MNQALGNLTAHAYLVDQGTGWGGICSDFVRNWHILLVYICAHVPLVEESSRNE